jgi:hypothetical protein
MEGFEDLVPLTMEQRRAKLAQERIDRENWCNANGVIRIAGVLPGRFWEIDGKDCEHVVEGLFIGTGGFRHTIQLLMKAGF